ncbi:unnamed protein product, partial [Polarella glacialis]
ALWLFAVAQRTPSLRPTIVTYCAALGALRQSPLRRLRLKTAELLQELQRQRLRPNLVLLTAAAEASLGLSGQERSSREALLALERASLRRLSKPHADQRSLSESIWWPSVCRDSDKSFGAVDVR